MSGCIKNCESCGYRRGAMWNAPICMRTMKFCEVQRSFKTDDCDQEFSGWVPRKKSLTSSFLFRLAKNTNTNN